MVCILEEMVREPVVKFVKEIICRVQGMAKRKWLCSVMKHTSLIVKRHQLIKFKIDSANRISTDAIAARVRVFPVL